MPGDDPPTLAPLAPVGRVAPVAPAGYPLGGCAPGQGLNAPVPPARESDALKDSAPDDFDGAYRAVRFHDEWCRRARNPHAEPAFKANLKILGDWVLPCLRACLMAEARFSVAKSQGAADLQEAWFAWKEAHEIARDVYRCVSRDRDFATPPKRPG